MPMPATMGHTGAAGGASGSSEHHLTMQSISGISGSAGGMGGAAEISGNGFVGELYEDEFAQYESDNI